MDVLHITEGHDLEALVTSRKTGSVAVAGVLIHLPRASWDGPSAVLAEVQRSCPGIPVAFFREDGPAHEAIRLLRLGAVEYFDDAASAAAWRPRAEHRATSAEVWRAFVIGDSPAMQPVFDTIRLLGPRRSTVLIQGETGTGKEMIARALHASVAQPLDQCVGIRSE